MPKSCILSTSVPPEALPTEILYPVAPFTACHVKVGLDCFNCSPSAGASTAGQAGYELGVNPSRMINDLKSVKDVACGGLDGLIALLKLLAAIVLLGSTL